VASLLLVALQIVSQVGADPATNVADDVDRLIRQLNDPDRQTRVDAEKELVELGPQVLTLLPAIDESTPAEVKDRLTRVRTTLEEQLARKAAESTRITLSGSKSLAEIQIAIREQTNNQLVDFRERFGQQDEKLRIDVNFQDAPFWPTLDSILDQLGLTVYSYGGEPRKLALVAKSAGERSRTGSASYVGPFRLEATEIMAYRNLRQPQNANLQLKFEVLWEPRLLPILVRQPYSNIEITADNGNKLAIGGQGTAEIPVQSTVSGVEIAVPIALPDRSVKKITSLKGTLFVLVPGHEAAFEFSNLSGARNVIQKRAGIVVVLDRVLKNRALYEIRVRLRLEDGSQSLQSHLDWVSNNEAYLVADDKTRVENPSFERYLEREQEIGFAYLFPVDDISKYRFVYKTPAAIVELPIAFELKDIDLP
jgi:hypothetical protein